MLHRFLRKILLKDLLDTQGKGCLVPYHRSEVKETKLTGCYAKTRKPVTFVCPEPALKLLNLRLEVKKHTRVDFSRQLHWVAGGGGGGGSSGESKGLGLISSIAGSLQRLLSSSSSQSFYYAKPKTDLYSFVGFLLTAIYNFLCFYTYTVWVGGGGAEMGRPKLPPPFPLLLLPLFWDGAHPVTKLPSLRQLIPGNGEVKSEHS